MKLVIAPDSFKESISAKNAALAIQKGIKEVLPDADCLIIPMADGGEGTVEALIDGSKGTLIPCTVHGPLMEPVSAFWGLMGDGKTAVIEMAAASGLALVPKEKRDPRITTTFGTGELILAALKQGCTRIIMGIGGSATNDGGAGMLQALGYSFLDEQGKELPPGGAALARLHTLEDKQRHPLLEGVQFQVACDVNNPLCGPSGASAVYGPQKGANESMVQVLDEALFCFSKKIEEKFGRSILNVPGAGAAGGLGGGLLAFLQAKLDKGVDIVIQTTGLESSVAGADLVITGEGKMDAQTRHGKTPYGVAQIAKKHGVACIGVCGMLGEGAECLYPLGFDALFSIADKPMTLEESMARAADLLQKTASNIMRTYLIRNTIS